MSNILTLICSLLFFMIGVDKFYPFMEPPCSLANSISPIVWKIFGVLQLGGGILIWIPTFRKYVAGFFIVFMLTFSIYHITQNTYDIGGSISIAVLLALLVWDPEFMRGKKK